jgi:glycosyltransferase involved in cell wall biosynthesis
MRILIGSHSYAPAIGGIETVSRLLAGEWRRAGHEVRIVTRTSAAGGEDEAEVFRRPSRVQLVRLVADCEVFWQNNVSLHTAWPLLFARRPWIVTTQTWLRNTAGGADWLHRLKRWTLRRARNVYISGAVAEHVGFAGDVVLNPYDAAIFRRRPEIAREKELIFVGRLVSDKGADVLLRALGLLSAKARPRLTIVGGGPEDAALRSLAGELGVAEQVEFAGWLQGEALAERLNAHRVLVVPSRLPEPFGIVAVEGLACGCTAVGSRAGGLPQAIGPGGAMFTNGDAAGLAATLADELARPAGDGDAARESAVRAHLVQFEPVRVAARYLEIFAATRAATARCRLEK